MTNLERIHNKIKNHPYRMGAGDLTEYLCLFRDLSDAFYKELSHKKIKICWVLIHDINATVYHFLSSNYFKRMSEDRKTNELLFLEKALGSIHQYIDTGIVEYYYIYEYRDNKPKSWHDIIGEWWRYEYYEPENTYKLKITKQQATDICSFIEEQGDKYLEWEPNKQTYNYCKGVLNESASDICINEEA